MVKLFFIVLNYSGLMCVCVFDSYETQEKFFFSKEENCLKCTKEKKII